MSKGDLLKYTFYFCDLKSGDFDCEKKDTCKRYQTIKDEPYESYKDCSARLYNICRDGYKMYMKMDEIPKEENKENEL